MEKKSGKRWYPNKFSFEKDWPGIRQKNSDKKNCEKLCISLLWKSLTAIVCKRQRIVRQESVNSSPGSARIASIIRLPGEIPLFYVRARGENRPGEGAHREVTQNTLLISSFYDATAELQRADRIRSVVCTPGVFLRNKSINFFVVLVLHRGRTVMRPAGKKNSKRREWDPSSCTGLQLKSVKRAPERSRCLLGKQLATYVLWPLHSCCVF